VPDDVKSRRLTEILAQQNRISTQKNEACIGKTYKVLVEGTSKRSKDDSFGRNSQNTVVIFPAADHKPGDYVWVKTHRATTTSLIGETVPQPE
jgi:tRNA-2-methylthio-N6-dimethylallyladenosine synthase